MRAIDYKVTRFLSNGMREVLALIIASETPEELPTTGENVDGLSETDVFAPASVLYVVGDADTKVYAANESGAFVAQ